MTIVTDGFDGLAHPRQGLGVGDAVLGHGDVEFVHRDAVAELGVGGISEPLPFARSWMILRLDGRREGSVLPLRDVESQIRKVLYMREFTRLLDGHLARLEEASEIVWHEDRIQDWAQSES